MHYVLIDGSSLFLSNTNRHMDLSKCPERIVKVSNADLITYLTKSNPTVNSAKVLAEFKSYYKSLILDDNGSEITLNVDFSAYMFNCIRSFSYRNLHYCPTAVVWSGAFSKGINKAYSSFRYKEFQDTFDLKVHKPYVSEMQRAAVTLCNRFLAECSIPVYSFENYEAYDTMYTLVQQILAEDDNNTIDIITDNRNMLPLVRRKLVEQTVNGKTVMKSVNQVVVYLKTTSSVTEIPGLHFIKKHKPITADTWAPFLADCSAYKNFPMVFNNAFLYHILKGEDRAKIPAFYSLPYFANEKRKSFGKTKFDKLLKSLSDNGAVLERDFVYGSDVDKMIDYLRPSFSVDELQLLEKMIRLRIARNVLEDETDFYSLVFTETLNRNYLNALNRVFKLGLKYI